MIAPPSLPASADHFLPHGPEFIWLDQVLAVGEKEVICRVRLDLARAGLSDPEQAELDHRESLIRAIEGATLEWMAQTVGVFVGAGHLRRGQAPQIGFVIGCPELNFYQAPAEVSALLVQATPIWIDEQSGSFACKLLNELDGSVIAEGRLTAHEPKL